MVGLADSTSNKEALLICAAFLLLAAGFAGWSARPVLFGTPGGEFKNWREDISKDRMFAEVLEQVGGFHDQDIEENAALMQQNERLMLCSYFLSLAGPIVSAVYYLSC